MNALVEMNPRVETLTENDPRWARVASRDRTADGEFFYSVRNHRRVLPPFLPITPGKPQERAVSCQP